MSGCATVSPAGCWSAPVSASRWRGGPRLIAGSAPLRGASFVVQREIAPRSGALPAKKTGARRPPFFSLRSNRSDRRVLLRHHAVEHADREHGVEAAGIERGLGGRRLLLGRRLDEAQDLLLSWPDDEPDIEGHDERHPHA